MGHEAPPLHARISLDRSCICPNWRVIVRNFKRQMCAFSSLDFVIHIITFIKRYPELSESPRRPGVPLILGTLSGTGTKQPCAASSRGTFSSSAMNTWKTVKHETGLYFNRKTSNQWVDWSNSFLRSGRSPRVSLFEYTPTSIDQALNGISPTCLMGVRKLPLSALQHAFGLRVTQSDSFCHTAHFLDMIRAAES